MEKPKQSSKFSKFFRGITGTLKQRQKPTGEEDKATTPNNHVGAWQLDYEKTPLPRNKLPLPLPPVTEAICQLPYYHPHLTNKDDLTNFMSQYNLQEGYFLIRQSFNDPNSYTITVNHRTGLKHIRVIERNGRFLLKDRSFDTIDEMIQFYSHREIPNEENIHGVLLRFPIRRPPLEFGDYIVVSNGKQGISTSSVSGQNLGGMGKHGSVGDRPQPPTPRPPHGVDNPKLATPALPSVSEPTVSRTASTVDSTFPRPTGLPSANDPIPSKPFGPPSANDPIPLKPIGPPLANDPIPLKPFGPPSANDPISSNAFDPTLANDPLPSKPIGPPSTDGPIRLTPIGPSARRVGDSGNLSDASENDRCDCGLLLREAALPLGWSVHVSQDSDTKDQPFFLSPNNETYWDLPLTVALHLSPEQQDLIRNLRFDSDIKTDDAKALNAERLTTIPRGCPSRRREEAISTNTWVPCHEYESLWKALRRRDEHSPCLQNTSSDDSEIPKRPEQNSNTDSQHTSDNRHENEKCEETNIVHECASTFSNDNKTVVVA